MSTSNLRPGGVEVNRLPFVKKRQPKKGSTLWYAVRKSMPAFIGRPANRFRKQRTPPFMINPDDRYKLVWDGIVTLCVMYTTCVVPYRVCFRQEASGSFGALERVLDIAFLTDIVVNFITGVHLPNGDITYDRGVIIRAYLRGWFLIDILSTVPFDDLTKWFGVQDQDATAIAHLMRGLKILRLFKLARIRKLNKLFLSLEDSVYTNQSMLSLIKLAFTMLFIAHLVACLWFAVGYHSDEASISWVRVNGLYLDNPSITAWNQYLASMYWAIVTMATIGYGDIVGQNNDERLLNIAIMAIGVSFFGYVIGTITTLVANLDVSASLYDEHMTMVKEYILSQSIPKHMAKRIRDHFEYYYQNRSVFKEKKILKRLPSALRNEMIHHVHSKIVNNIKYFGECHESLISDIVMDMKPFSVLKDEYVYVQHEIAAHVFFLLKGKICLTKSTPNARETRLATLSVGEHFGELEVYDHQHGNGVRICSAIAKSYCELTFLSRQAISKISVRWPEVLRHFKDSAQGRSKQWRRRADALQDMPDIDDENALFRDDERSQKMSHSTLLVKKSMRPTRRKRTRLSRISPFSGHEDDSESESTRNQQLFSRPVVDNRRMELPEQHLPQIDDEDQIETVYEVDDNLEPQQCKKSVNNERASDHFSPTKFQSDESLRENSFDLETAAQSGVGNEDNFVHLRRPVSRAKIVLEALPGDRHQKVLPLAGNNELSDVDSSSQFPRAKRTALKIATSEIEDENEEVPPDTKEYVERNDAVVAHEHAQMRQHVEPLALEHSNGQPDGNDNDSDEHTVGTEGGVDASTHTPMRNGGSTTSQEHRRWFARKANVKDNDNSKPKASNPIVVQSTRNLHDMIAKIRDSPVSRPKPNIHSEQVMLKGTYVFHPQEPFILTWQFVIGLGIIYSIIVVPYRLGFDADPDGFWYYLEFVIDGFFLVDILFNFRTAYFDEERVLIFDSRIVFWRYVKGWFFADLISTLPIDELAKLFIGSNATVNFLPTKLLRLLRIARLLKLARLIKLSRVFGRLRDMIDLGLSLERLIKLLVITLVFCHWNACAFHAVMMLSESTGYRSWCNDFFYKPVHGEPCTSQVDRYNRYIAAMYWAFTTFTTVGYGDIKPSLYSPHELALVIFLVVVNATAFGYVISSVITLIKNLDPSDREFRLRMTEMKDYLRDSTVSSRLGANIKAHYKHNILSTSMFPEEKIFDKMSPSLRFDTARLVAGETLFAIPLITVMEDSFKGFVSYALFLLKPICIMRTEKVCRSGGPGTEMFFLVEGECDLVNSHTGEGRIVGENAVFEQYALMTRPDEIYRTVSTVTAITKKCILYSLTIQDFKILEEVSPAVSTYFLSQLAAVLIEDDLYMLTPQQKENVECALRNGRAFRAMAEQHQKAKLHSIGNVAMARLSVPKRRGSEWAPDLLPRLLNQLERPPGEAGSHVSQSLAAENIPSHPNGIPESDL